MSTTALSTYDQAAIDFLNKHRINFRATLAKKQKAPGWADENKEHGLYYRITLSKSYKTKKIYPSRITFDFWDSIAAKEKGETPSAYSVLACISGDVHCPETFEDFCAEYGYNEDSRAAYATFKRCTKFSRRLRDFFTAQEIKELAEIQ